MSSVPKRPPHGRYASKRNGNLPGPLDGRTDLPVQRSIRMAQLVRCVNEGLQTRSPFWFGGDELSGRNA